MQGPWPRLQGRHLVQECLWFCCGRVERLGQRMGLNPPGCGKSSDTQLFKIYRRLQDGGLDLHIEMKLARHQAASAARA